MQLFYSVFRKAYLNRVKLLFVIIFFFLNIFVFELTVDMSKQSSQDKTKAYSPRFFTHSTTPKKSYPVDKKIILLWHRRGWQNRTLDATCGNCVFTYNKSEITNRATGAILFRADAIEPESMPLQNERRKDQLYIWTTGESAPSLFHLRQKWLFWEDKYNFNMTMSFRRDSILYNPYGTACEAYKRITDQGLHKTFPALLQRKTKLAAAAVSNCNSTAGARARLSLLQELGQGGHRVDLLGRCFGNEIMAKSNSEEFTNFLKQYKFFLAFENSYRCRDYITEKFYRNALYIGVVPVVWGTAKEDYLAVAPNNSFIHVEDFETTDQLMKYLNYLDKNDTAYLQYFKWYRDGDWNSRCGNVESTYCRLCKMLYRTTPQKPIEFKITPSLRQWFYSAENLRCLKTKLRRNRKTLHVG